MADSKDSSIKLFGKTIPLRRSEEVSSTDEPSVAVSVVDSDAGESSSDRKASVPCSNDDSRTALPGQNSGDEDKETSGKENIVTEDIVENGEEEDANLESPSAEQSEISDPQEKTLKRPDKIIPCPRCNSMDTKFCYYNNYNVNQPRHFCKNCQRYWTAGGTMRNVPVGAGRRKNKNSSSASHYRHLVISDALHRAQANAAAVAGPGTVLTFGGSSEKSGGDNQSSCSSVVTASTSSEIVGKQLKDDRVAQVPVSWPYSWASPAFCHSGFPVSFYPAPPQYWGSAVAAPWNMPCFPAAPSQCSLGKHSRDGEILNPASKERAADGSDRPVLIPKTLRIDDPTEAAKSSIWTTLGIKNEKLGGSVNSGGLYKMFQSKGEGKGHVLETSPVLQANPAALSRSLRFLESA